MEAPNHPCLIFIIPNRISSIQVDIFKASERLECRSPEGNYHFRPTCCKNFIPVDFARSYDLGLVASTLEYIPWRPTLNCVENQELLPWEASPMPSRKHPL